MLADWMRVAQVVMLLDERLDQRLLRRAANLADVQWPEIRKTRHQRGDADLNGLHHRVATGLLASPSRRRQLHMAFPVQSQHQPTADRVAPRPIGLSPPPCPANHERQRPTTRSRVLRDQLSHKRDIVRVDCASPMPKYRFHERDTYRATR